MNWRSASGRVAAGRGRLLSGILARETSEVNSPDEIVETGVDIDLPFNPQRTARHRVSASYPGRRRQGTGHALG